MKKFFLAIFIICTLGVQARTVFCSSSAGNDKYDGSEERPVATIQKALTLGDEILLKRGDVFYERVSARGIRVDAYGEGPKPQISGLKMAGAKAKWETGKIVDGKWKKDKNGNIHRIKLSTDKNFSGFKTGGSSWFNNIGAVVMFDADSVYECRRCREDSDMQTDFDFWQPASDPAKLATKDFDYLYLYFNSNPTGKNIGFSVGTTGVSISNGTLKNVAVKYWGGHGIAAGSNLVVENCDVDYIGGMIQRGYSSWVCLGNGIEIWCENGASDVLVSGCTFSRCFDAGMTIQGIYKNPDVEVKNITFANNTVFNCCQGWEDFYRDSQRKSPLKFINCFVRDNMFYNNGMATGFRYWDNRFKRCQVLGNSSAPTGMQIVDNTFVNGNFRCCSRTETGLYDPQSFAGNTVYIVRGQFLISNYVGSADVVFVPSMASPNQSLEVLTEQAIQKYRTLTGDQSTKFVVLDTESDTRMISPVNLPVRKD